LSFSIFSLLSHIILHSAVSEQEFNIQALLELDPVLQELTWHQKFSALDIDAELAALKQRLNLNAALDDQPVYEWQNIILFHETR
jgi:hypothetical protein